MNSMEELRFVLNLETETHWGEGDSPMMDHVWQSAPWGPHTHTQKNKNISVYTNTQNWIYVKKRTNSHCLSAFVAPPQNLWHQSKDLTVNHNSNCTPNSILKLREKTVSALKTFKLWGLKCCKLLDLTSFTNPQFMDHTGKKKHSFDQKLHTLTFTPTKIKK